MIFIYFTSSHGKIIVFQYFQTENSRTLAFYIPLRVKKKNEFYIRKKILFLLGKETDSCILHSGGKKNVDFILVFPFREDNKG